MFTLSPRARAFNFGPKTRWIACICAAVAAGLTGAASPREAAAQIVLVPASSDAARLGPRRAEGVVIWSHGRSVDQEDSRAPTPDYVGVMVSARWDAFRLNRMRKDDTLTRSGAALAVEAERLKAAGYRRVVLAGQSFGGFISLIAAGQSNAVDAVIATAPAAFGNFETNHDTFRQNATALYELLGVVRRAHVALAFFHGDTFDPGGRGEQAKAILSRRGLPHLVIDQPARLVSHWASSTPEFTRRFSSCLVAFATNNAPPAADECDAMSAAQQVAATGGPVRSGGRDAPVSEPRGLPKAPQGPVVPTAISVINGKNNVAVARIAGGDIKK